MLLLLSTGECKDAADVAHDRFESRKILVVVCLQSVKLAVSRRVGRHHAKVPDSFAVLLHSLNREVSDQKNLRTPLWRVVSLCVRAICK